MIALVAALLVASSTSSVPTTEHFAACNAEARDAVTSRGSGSGSAAAAPMPKDRQRAEEARRGQPGRSDDAQLSGMDPDGAKDPAYQAAYRSCMRRSGF